TFTRDVIAELLNTARDRSHPELPVENVLMPRDVLNAMAERLHDAPMFSRAEGREFEERLVGVKNHVFDRQEADVIDAIMFEKRVERETVEEYVEHVYAWATDDTVGSGRDETEPDPLLMKVFEIEHLGRFGEHEYDGTTPMPPVRTFRRERIITALNRHAWQNRTEDFAIDAVDVMEIPVIRDVLESHGWSDVSRVYEDFDPDQWDDPPAATETATVKGRTIGTLVSEFGYSPASAELTSRHVMGQVSYRWD
ncbi:MAG: kinase anchor protein, partial [Halalkalicoccus sp.]